MHPLPPERQGINGMYHQQTAPSFSFSCSGSLSVSFCTVSGSGFTIMDSGSAMTACPTVRVPRRYSSTAPGYLRPICPHSAKAEASDLRIPALQGEGQHIVLRYPRTQCSSVFRAVPFLHGNLNLFTLRAAGSDIHLFKIIKTEIEQSSGITYTCLPSVFMVTQIDSMSLRAAQVT